MQNILSNTPIIFMKVGPHSGFTLKHIFEMKLIEEKLYKRFYWGYSGTLCHPLKVNEFVYNCIKLYNRTPLIVMAETKSDYYSTIGCNKSYSFDGEVFTPLPKRVIMIGCRFAMIGKNMRIINKEIDLNDFVVANGTQSGKPLSRFIQYQINKACAYPRHINKQRCSAHFTKIVCLAEMVSPYCVYLA